MTRTAAAFIAHAPGAFEWTELEPLFREAFDHLAGDASILSISHEYVEDYTVSAHAPASGTIARAEIEVAA